MKIAWVRQVSGHPAVEQFGRLKEYGVPERRIYVDGFGAENVQVLINTIRKGDEAVYVAADLRVFGGGYKEILGVTDQLEAKKVRIIDVRDPEASLSVLLDRAMTELRKYARKVGGEGKARVSGLRGAAERTKAFMQRRDGVAASRGRAAARGSPQAVVAGLRGHPRAAIF